MRADEKRGKVRSSWRWIPTRALSRCFSNATGASCGNLVAAAYCRSQEFADARSFRKVEREEITGAVPTGASCSGSCEAFVAIECTR